MGAENFLNYHSWFDKEYERGINSGLRYRYYTFRVALNLLYQLPNHNIVETGSVRFKDDWGSGYSTYVFGDFIKHYRGHLTTIDKNQEIIDRCKEVTMEFASDITYVCDDSLIALVRLDQPIDLLYLDSMDVWVEGYQQHNLKEFKAAERLLHPGSIILIDDNDEEDGGKPYLTKQYLSNKGYKCLLDYHQSLWVK